MHHTEEAKQKIRLAGLGRLHTEEAKSKMAKAKKDKKLGPQSEEHKDHIRKALTGLVRGPQTAEHVSKAVEGRRRNLEKKKQLGIVAFPNRKGLLWSVKRRENFEKNKKLAQVA